MDKEEQEIGDLKNSIEVYQLEFDMLLKESRKYVKFFFFSEVLTKELSSSPALLTMKLHKIKIENAQKHTVKMFGIVFFVSYFFFFFF